MVAKGLKRICFYTSDYGYGHAARDIALIRKIQRDGFAEVVIKTDTAFDFMRRSLPGCNVERRRNDIGLIYKDDTVEVDRDSTERALEIWVSSWDNYIRTERDFCKNNKIDLIISDITPQSFLLAEDLGVPGVGFSNFTWYYIFSNLLGDSPAVQRLEEAYRAGDLALVLPFHEEMGLFKSRKEIPLISRDITVKRETLRARHGLQKDELLIYLGVGKSLTPGLFKNLRGIELSGKKLLISSSLELSSTISQENVVRIPSTEIESQNYLAMADLVISKTGYSTVSEAIRGRVPMFLFRRDGYEEDRLIAQGVESLGIGQEIQVEDFLEGRCMEELADLDKYRDGFNRLIDMFKIDGTSMAIDAIKEMVL
jgi:uncharacterized protein (TIGR00661 family)